MSRLDLNMPSEDNKLSGHRVTIRSDQKNFHSLDRSPVRTTLAFKMAAETSNVLYLLCKFDMFRNTGGGGTDYKPIAL